MTLTPDSKVLFRVQNDGAPEYCERLWAQSLGGDLYMLANSPFDFDGVSWGDTVYAVSETPDSWPFFQRLVKKSGNRTVRLYMSDDVDVGYSPERRWKLLRGLKKLGCGYEGAWDGQLSLNIPPETEFQVVLDYLIARKVMWEYADPTYAERSRVADRKRPVRLSSSELRYARQNTTPADKRPTWRSERRRLCPGARR